MTQEFKVGDLVRFIPCEKERLLTNNPNIKPEDLEGEYPISRIFMGKYGVLKHLSDYAFDDTDLELIQPTSPQPTMVEVRAQAKCPKPLVHSGTRTGRFTSQQSNMVEIEHKLDYSWWRNTNPKPLTKEDVDAACSEMRKLAGVAPLTVHYKALLGNHSQQTWQDWLVDLLIDGRYSEAAAIMAEHKEEINDIAESVEDALEAIREGDA